MPHEELQKATIEYMEGADLNHRKEYGQYFTPKTIRDELIKQLPKSIKNPKILDPACGTGEFLLTAKEYFTNPKLSGWEIDKKLVGISSKLVPSAFISNADSLLKDEYGQYDFVIGNPPYFEFKPDQKLEDKFKEIIGGRTNIFGLFIYQGLKLLKDGGYLAFVVPPSMNNGAYFSKLREYIVANSNIEYLKVLKNPKMFHEALQSTMIIVLKKGENRGSYIFRKNGLMIFSEEVGKLKRAFSGKKTLSDLDYSVRTGKIVWNQNKHLLTNDPKNSYPLIWAHNITENGLKLSINNPKKPQYIKATYYDVGPAIVVNRITGSLNSTKLKSAVVPAGLKFFAENHVNVIYPPSCSGKQMNMYFVDKKDNDPSLLKKIASQLASSIKMEILSSITGNTQISKTELERLVPLEI